MRAQRGARAASYAGRIVYGCERDRAFVRGDGVIALAEARSEEHTSELQSHSEISYAVFCLKKKT